MKTDFAPALHAADRLRDISRLGLHRETGHPYLQDIVDATAIRLHTPIALITVVLNDALLILAGYGPLPAWMAEAGGMPAEWAFCRRLVADRSASAIPDLTADPDFFDSPLVTVGGLRAYIGAPLISHSGQVLGGLCSVDLRTRPFGRADVAFLSGMAETAVERLETHAPGDAAAYVP